MRQGGCAVEPRRGMERTRNEARCAVDFSIQGASRCDIHVHAGSLPVADTRLPTDSDGR